MYDKLVIVESPSKSKTIENYLGKEYHVTSSKGHIRDLSTSGKEGLGIDQEDHYKPKYVISKDKKDVVKELKAAVKEAKTVYLVDACDYDLGSPYQIIQDFNEWMEKGFEIEDIDGEDIRGVDYGDLYLIKMPKEGVKGLVTIKRAFNLEISTGELLQNSKSLPTKLLSNITSSKANIIAEKIGMPGLFEIR